MFGFSDILETALRLLGLEALFNFILQKFPVLQKAFDLAKKIVGHFTGTFSAGLDLFHSFQSEIAAWKNFKEDFRIKMRVVNIERAIQKTKDLVTGLFDSWKAILDLIKSFTTKAELEGAAEVAEAATGIGLPVAIVNAIVLVVQTLDLIRNTIDDIQTVVNEITRIREAVENADTIFLQQKNPRKIVKLADGTTMKIRVGKLHS